MISYEVPLSDESDGQLKIDLFGYSDSSLEIVELKGGNNGKNNPLMALTEAICYAIQLGRCGVPLLEPIREVVPEVDDEFFDRIRITVAAPSKYWNHWDPNGTDMEGVIKQMHQIVGQVNRAFEQKGRSTRISLARAEITQQGFEIKGP